jgi:hypothetical protein
MTVTRTRALTLGDRSLDPLALVGVLVREDNLDVLGNLGVGSGNALELVLDDLVWEGLSGIDVTSTLD